MKKVFLFVVLFTLVLNFTGAQETITVKGQELIIPEEYGKLKSAYVEMVGMYLETEEDLTVALENNDKLVEKNKELNRLLDKAQENTEKAVENTETLIEHSETLMSDIDTLIEEAEYWMNKKTYVSISPSFIYKNSFLNTEVEFAFGVQTEILNSFSIGVHYWPINSYSISLEYSVFSY